METSKFVRVFVVVNSLGNPTKMIGYQCTFMVQRKFRSFRLVPGNASTLIPPSPSPEIPIADLCNNNRGPVTAQLSLQSLQGKLIEYWAGVKAMSYHEEQYADLGPSTHRRLRQ